MEKNIEKKQSLFHTKDEHIINTRKIKTCDKSHRNRNVINNNSKETDVKIVTYRQFERKINGKKVLVEYPDEPDYDENEEIIKEVKLILSNLLQEQIAKAV